MNSRTVAVVASILIGSAALSACSSKTQGKPAGTPTQPIPTTPATGATSAQKLLSPPVSKPLDATQFLNVNNVCKILNVKQLNAIDMPEATAGGQQSTEAATSCSYNTVKFGMNIAFMTGNTGGLSDLYSQKSTKQYWQPLKVQGYPAVAASGDDGRKKGTCVINVGVTNHLYFFAQYTGRRDPSGKVACEGSKKAADQVINTLKTRPNP